MEATFVVVGGGIAGVSCAETLALYKPDENIILITESPIVKAIVNLQAITKTLSSFDVVEKDANSLHDSHQNITVIQDNLLRINSKVHTVLTTKNVIKYKYLCICTGAKPKLIQSGENFPFVLGIRDTDSVDVLIERISKSKRLTVIGNGGIATELVHKVENIEVDWVIKDKHISATFVDPGAAEFFKTSLNKSETSKNYSTRMRYTQESKSGSGAALGPDWYTNIDISGAKNDSKSVKIHQECEVSNVTYNSDSEFPVNVHLTNGQTISCNLIVSATGVLPRTDFETDVEFELSDEHGITVDEFMNTSIPDIFAAGDVCAPKWQFAKHWFPMKLWTQARLMGCYAAKCMAAKMDSEDILQDFSFELFAHSTNLFGYKVVLLGLYNGQTLGTDYECLIRMTAGVEFIKFVLKDHKLQGAILIGNTDLAETCENLILNQLDLEPFGDDILNPDVDIEDYFD